MGLNIVLAVLLRGIVLLGEGEPLLSKEELAEVDGVCVYAIPETDGKFYLDGELCEKYVGQPWSLETLEEMKKTIAGYYAAEGNPFVLTTIPEQNVTQNVVQAVILQAKLGKLEFEGNSWTPTEAMERYLSLESGSPISIQKVEKNLNFFNRNPFRRAHVVYGPGEEAGEADMTIVVEERRSPFRFIAGCENNGVVEIERDRWFSGFSCARFLKSESFFSFQYTSSFDWNLFRAYTAQWQLLLPWQHELDLYGGYSRVRHANLQIPDAPNGGRTYQASLRYTIPLPWALNWRPDFFFGVDWKNLNSFIEFGDFFQSFDDDLTIFDVVAGASCVFSRSLGELRMRAEVLASPGEWLPDQSNHRYNDARFGATNYWVRTRGEVELLFFLRWTTFRFFVEGQYSHFILVPSEQMGVGGFGSVRGYTERQLNADTGFVGSFEWCTPHFPVISALRGKKMRDGLQFLAFTDYGLSYLNRPFGTEPTSDYLWSFGAGARYTLDAYLTARFDWGYKLHLGTPAFPFYGPRNLIHFSVILSIP